MLKFGWTLTLLCMAALPVSSQTIYSPSVSVSGTTVTVSMFFDAGFSIKDYDQGCPPGANGYPFVLYDVSYQVDGGSSVDVPYNSGWQTEWQSGCTYSNQSNGYTISFSYTGNAGNHNVQVTLAYTDNNNDGGFISTDQLSYSVGGGPILIDGGNLQNSNSWNYCISASCSPVPPCQGCFLWPLSHVSSPSTTGSSLETYQYGPAYWGILYYYPHNFTSQEVNATNFQVQWQYYVDSSSYIQALEFDFPVIYNNLAFYFGSQCVQGANWQYWNPNNSTWNDFSPEVPCTETGANTWHTLVWNGTRTSSQFTYQTLQIDGQQYTVNTTLTAPTNTTGIANNSITIQFQPDGNYVNPNPGYHEWIDNVQASVW